MARGETRQPFLDDLAKGLDDGTISRRGALRLAGAAALGAALAPFLPEQAEALSRRARRKCRNKGGIPLEKGQCNCGWQCGADIDLFRCHGDKHCVCYEDVNGRGFCGTKSGSDFCSEADPSCPSGTRCVLNTCSGGLCIPPCP